MSNCNHGEIAAYPGMGAQCQKCGAWATFRAAPPVPALPLDREVIARYIGQSGWRKSWSGCLSEADSLIEELRAVAVPVPALDALRTMSEAATPGRWFVDGGGEVSADHTQPLMENPWPIIMDSEGLLPAVEPDDAAFIAAAVNYVRAALQEGETRHE